jgi:tetratricopeptide (TPR) repeat protein
LLRRDVLMRTQRGRLPVQSHRRRHALLATLFGVAFLAVACTTDPAVKKQQYLDSGNSYFDQGKYAEAIIEYRNAIGLDATFGQARKRLAESYARAGNPRGSFDEFIRAADLLPTDVNAQLTAGNLLLVARQPQEALARADAALKVQPENIDALILRGSALAGLTSFDEALASIEQAIKLDPDRGTTYTSLGIVQIAQGRRDDAEATLRRAVSLSPKETQTHLALGNFYWSLGRTKEAEQAFEGALKVEPANLRANRFMAAFKFSTGRPAEAEPYLRRIADSSKDGSGTLGLVDYYLMTGRPKDAIARLDALPNGRNIRGVVLRLARAHAAASEQPKARALVDEILKANPKDADAQLLKGQLLLQDGKRDEAFEAVRAATSANPSSPDAQFALGRMYAVRGDNAAAQAAFREVLRINPRAAAAQVQLARLQGQAGQPADSLRTAEEAAKNNPTNVAVRLELVRSLMVAKDLARAEREIEKLQADYPNVAAVHVQESRLAMLKKDVRAARAALEQAEKLDPGSTDTLAAWLALDIEQNDAAGAKARLEARLQKGSNPDLLLLAGRTYLVLKDSASAEKALRAAIDADPSRIAPYETLGSLYLSQKKLDQALKEFETLATRQAKPVGALTMSGMILEQQGKRDLARKRYEEALVLDSRAATPANNLAWILAEMGEDLDRALQLAQIATAASPEVPQIMDTLGWVYYKKNQPALAIPLFQQCVEKAPAVPEYHYHLGLALLKSGDTAKGRVALQRALDAKPSAAVSAEIRRALESAN